MKQETSHWPIIFDIIRAGMAQRADGVALTAQELADRVEHPDVGAGDPQIAKRIRRIVAESPDLFGASDVAGQRSGGTSDRSAHTAMTFGSMAALSGSTGPVDGESRTPFVDEVRVEELELAGVSGPPILAETATAELARFVALQRHRAEVQRAGLPVPRTLLLYGPPGCGKTTAARYIAAALQMPLLTVRLDAVISSYLGTTAKNLRTVFDYAAGRGGILFLDEFDAVAKMRDDANEVGEIKRIVNGLIQHLDSYADMPLIAATNHEHLLDPAIWRRFDSVIGLAQPEHLERQALLRLFLTRRYATAGRDDRSASNVPGRIAHRASSAADATRRPLRAATVAGAPVQPPSAMPDPDGTGEQGHAAQLDDEEVEVLAQIAKGCSGADLERFVVRARQEMVLAELNSDRATRAPQVLAASMSGAGAGASPSFPAYVLLEIWRMLEPTRFPSETTETEETPTSIRSAAVDFIERQSEGRASARVISSLTGIPASTVARIRQQRERRRRAEGAAGTGVITEVITEVIDEEAPTP